MQAQASSSIWEFVLFWIFSGSSLLGLPPGERDVTLLKAVPPQTLFYFEWAARGQGATGAVGVDGFAADTEIQQFFAALEAAIAKREVLDDEDSHQELYKELPPLIKIMSAHPGCVFLGFEPPRGDRNGIGGLIDNLKGVHGGAVFSTGDDTDATWLSLNRSLTSSVPGFMFDSSSMTQSIPISIPGYQLVLHREGQRILFALGEGTLPRIVEGLSGRLPGMESNQRFRQSFDHLAAPRVSTVGWIDGQGIIASTMTALGPLGGLVKPLLALVGIDALDHIVQTSGVEKDSMIQRTFISTGGKTDGIFVLAAGQPIQAAQISHIPADADLVLVTSISLKGIFQEARKLLATAQPLTVRVFDEAVKNLEAELELKIIDDVLPAFGDVVTAFDSPSSGGVIATSLVVSLEVRDAAKATRVYERLMKVVEQSLVSEHEENGYNASSSFRQQPFLGHTISYVHSAGRGLGAAITPTFCLTDRHLLFAIHPQAMKAQLRHLQSKRPGFDQVVHQKVTMPAGDVLTFAYLDGPRANGLTSAALPFLSKILIERLEIDGISLDSFAIPSAAAISPYFGDSTVVITRMRDGLVIETKNSPPVVVSLALLSAYNALHTSEFDFLEEVRRRKGNGGNQVQLGAAEGEVVPAVAQTKEAAAPPEKPDPSPYRQLAPLFLKALVPNEFQGMIPESTLKQLEEGPSAATVERREEARRKREEQRLERRRRRLEGRP